MKEYQLNRIWDRFKDKHTTEVFLIQGVWQEDVYKDNGTKEDSETKEEN